jgi:hypothetical protein
MTIRGREAALRAAAPLATKARSRERLRMPKVGPSLVDIPVTVNREGVCIMTGFPESRGDDGPDHDNDGRRAARDEYSNNGHERLVYRISAPP